MKTDFKNMRTRDLEGFNVEIKIDGDEHKVVWTWRKNKEGDKK